MNDNNQGMAGAAAFDEAMKRGLSYAGLFVLNVLRSAPSSLSLNCQGYTVVTPKKLARIAGDAPRGMVLKGLKELRTTGYGVDVKVVTGEKRKNYTFAARLFTPREVLQHFMKGGI